MKKVLFMIILIIGTFANAQQEKEYDLDENAQYLQRSETSSFRMIKERAEALHKGEGWVNDLNITHEINLQSFAYHTIYYELTAKSYYNKKVMKKALKKNHETIDGKDYINYQNVVHYYFMNWKLS